MTRTRKTLVDSERAISKRLTAIEQNGCNPIQLHQELSQHDGRAFDCDVLKEIKALYQDGYSIQEMASLIKTLKAKT